VAVLSTRNAGHFTSSAGRCFAGMPRKFENGELRLADTLWRLRDEKWGRKNRQRVVNRCGGSRLQPCVGCISIRSAIA
jgi:hypothetical protein